MNRIVTTAESPGASVSGKEGESIENCASLGPVVWNVICVEPVFRIVNVVSL